MADERDNDGALPSTDQTHPLPSDMEGGSPGPANAPHAPADITPSSDVDGDTQQAGDTTQPDGSDSTDSA